jgi:hypothetical protein
LTPPLALALLLASVPGPAGGGAAPVAVAVSGVPMSGVEGTVKRQRAEGGVVVLSLDRAEIRVAPWPGPGRAPQLVGHTLQAAVTLHPEGPMTRLELRPQGQAVGLVIVVRARAGTPVAGGVELGIPAADQDGASAVPLLVDGKMVSRPRAGVTTRVRTSDGTWCVALGAIDLPPPAPLGLSDDRREAWVDVAARRLSEPDDCCASAP